METIKKIVVATDFSDNAKAASEYARRLADSFGAALHVSHVIAPTLLDADQALYTNFPNYEARVKEDNHFLAELVQEDNEKRRGAPGSVRPPTTYGAEVGFVPSTLVEISEDPSVDLLVIGATGAGSWLDRLLGGVADQVGREAHCPVLLVPHGARFKGIRRIVYAAAGDSVSLKAVETAISWARHFGAAVDFIHIETPDNIGQSENAYQIALEADVAEPAVKHQAMRMKSESFLEGLKSHIEMNPADLIVVVTKQRDFWNNMTHHSATRDLIWHNDLPILILHENDRRATLPNHLSN